MVRVGSSTLGAGSGSGCSGSHSVQPIESSSTPVKLHDVAGNRLGNLDPLQALEAEHLVHLREHRRFARNVHHHLVGGAQPAAADAADADAADVARVVERADLQLQRPVGVAVARRRDAREDGFEQRAHVGAAFARLQRRPAVQRGGVDHREIELLLGRAELVEQVEGVVHHPVGARAGRGRSC